MKHVLLFVTMLGFFYSCSHSNETEEKIDTPFDEAIILHYKNGDEIVLQVCDAKIIRDLNPVRAKKNCLGKIKKVPIQLFQESLENLIEFSDRHILNLLTSKDFKHYQENGPDKIQLEAILNEFEKVQNFLSFYGGEKSKIFKRDDLINELPPKKKNSDIFFKINTEIKNTVKNLIQKPRITNLNDKMEKILTEFLKQYHPHYQFPCGLKGSLSERIKDCSDQPNSSKEGFVLVSRSEKFHEVYQEKSTGLLWGDRVLKNMDQESAVKFCRETYRNLINLDDTSWKLPSKEDFEKADRSGIRNALSKMKYWFWSSTLNEKNIHFAWIFNGRKRDDMDHNFVRDHLTTSVRCVGVEQNFISENMITDF